MSPRRHVLPFPLAVALVAACTVETDRSRYEAGETGRASVENVLPVDAWVGLCPSFVYERLIDGEWTSLEPPAFCLAVARRLAPQERFEFAFEALERGSWRLRVPAGVGCEETGALAGCTHVGDLLSEPFEVTSPGGGCFVGGCSAELCADEPLASVCWWFPEFACYRDATCGRFGEEGTCAWKPTPELQACLEELEGPGDLVPMRFEP